MRNTGMMYFGRINGFMFLLPFPRCSSRCGIAGPEGGEESGGECSPTDSDPFSNADFGTNLADASKQFAASANRRFEFQKRRQLFIRSHNETFSLAMSICTDVVSSRRNSTVRADMSSGVSVD